MKPSWKNAPIWANFLSKYRDGMWYWYEYKPVITNHYSDWWFNFEGGQVAVAQFSEPWESSLEARPKAKAKPVKKQAKKTKKKGKKK